MLHDHLATADNFMKEGEVNSVRSGEMLHGGVSAGGNHRDCGRIVFHESHLQ
jgi:hypothetical protein